MQNASNKDPASFGRQGTEAVQRWHQPRRKRNGALRGVCPLYSYGAVETVFGPGSCTISNRRPLRDCPPARRGRVEEMLSTRKGRQRGRDDVCLQLRCKRTQPYAPADLSCLRSACKLVSTARLYIGE